jgi:MoaA/NifB/PqqE/SkfB family radical SAM enzyme
LRAVARDKARYNTLLNQRELWHGRVRLDSFPRGIQVGTNWTCNLRCGFCARQTSQKGRFATLPPARREMAPEVVDLLLDLMPYAEVFSLTPLGEPLLFSGLERILERHQAAGRHNLRITTNGALLDERHARRLVEAGTRTVLVSLDTADPELYARMRPPGSLNQVTDGLERLNEWKDRLGAAFPEVILAATFLRENIEGLPDLIRYAGAHHIETVQVQLMEAEDPAMAAETLDRHAALAARMIAEGRRVAAEVGVDVQVHFALQNLLSAESGAQPQTAPDRRSLIERCDYPWTSLLVDTDGEVRPCCWASYRYGNLAEASFDEVWNGRAAQGLRRAFLHGVLPSGCRDQHCRIGLSSASQPS